MATYPKPDSSKLPTLPGGGQPHVPQPGQFVPAGLAQQARASADVTGPPKAASLPARPPRSAAYTDPLLFEEGFFSNQAEYDQTVRLAAAKVLSGQIQAREPDLDENEKK